MDRICLDTSDGSPSVKNSQWGTGHRCRSVITQGTYSTLASPCVSWAMGINEGVFGGEEVTLRLLSQCGMGTLGTRALKCFAEAEYVR